MIITVEPSVDPGRVQKELVSRGLWTQRLDDGGGGHVHFLVEAHSQHVERDELMQIPGVAAVAVAAPAHPRVDALPRRFEVGSVVFGAGAPPVVLAGPCSVESEEQLSEVAGALASLGVQFLRGGAFKPRTSPYAFQGRGEAALRWLRDAADRNGLKVVTEAMGSDEIGRVAEVADVIQVGSRNMHNYALLKAIGRARKPVLLKRGMAATVEEWLLAGEYCLANGSPGILFCERGLRGFDPSTRNLLDFGAVALLAHVHGLPVIVDPSHGAGRRDLIAPLTRAAIAVGASGVMIETHFNPGQALSDGPQALSLAQLKNLLPQISHREVSHV